MFRLSLEKAKVPIKLVALVNDTTGSLIASNYVDPTTKIGVILGTGCNAAVRPPSLPLLPSSSGPR